MANEYTKFLAPAKQFIGENSGNAAQKQPFRAPILESSKPLKEVLDENKRRAEEEWAADYKLRGPKPMDDDEYEFLESKENERRLVYLEREIEDMAELEKFQKEIKSKVFTVAPPKDTTPVTAPTAVVAKNPIYDVSKKQPTPTTTTNKKKTKPPVVIVPQKKRKTEGEFEQKVDTDKKDKEDKETKGFSLVDYGNDDD